MAQYGRNFYGSSYYGETAAYSSEYTTTEVRTDEPLRSTFDVNINSVMPHVIYGPNHTDIIQEKGTWKQDTGKITSDTPSAELIFVGSCDKFSILYEQRSTGTQKVNVEISSVVPGKTPVKQTLSFSTNSTTVNTNARFDVTGLEYTIHTVRIFLEADNPAGSFFNFKGIDARVCDFTVETRSRLNTGAWTAWTKIAITDTPRQGVKDGYYVTGRSPNYAGKNRVQVRVWMATSDYTVAPLLEDLTMIAGDSSNRTEDGTWEAIINMKEVAKLSSKTFKRILKLDWTETIPAGTSLNIHSMSSEDSIFYKEETAPYRLKTKRVRLREGITEGYIDTPIVSPDSKYPFVKTLYWDKWNDQSFLPPNNAGTDVKYIFMDTSRKETDDNYFIQNPMNDAKRNLDRAKLGQLDLIVRIRLHRNHNLLATPVVDWITLTSAMEYNQTKDYTNVDFSAVDRNNTGKGVILDTAPLGTYFTPPPSAPEISIMPGDSGNLWYKLEDETRRPLDVILYLDSEKDNPMGRENRSKTLNNKVWAETKERVPKHYQYGGGDVQYPHKEEVEIATSFTPSLVKEKQYRYHLLKGWPTTYHKVQKGDTWKSIAELHEVLETELKKVNPKPTLNPDGSLMEGNRIQIPNNSYNNKVKLTWKYSSITETSKSAHNAQLTGGTQFGNDFVVSEVVNASKQGEIDWVSGEKIYDGIINVNGIRGEYKRVHSTPESGDSAELTHTAVAGETYASIAARYGVYEEDLRFRNKAEADSEVTVGQFLFIPSKIVLPFVVPEAIVDDNPYVIDIVANSVVTADGKQLDEANVFPVNNLPIQVVYREKEVEATVKRGPVLNEKDPLPNPRVKKVLSVKYNGRTYNQYDPFTGSGDFLVKGNFIDWSPTGGTTAEPPAGAKYTVRYRCEVPDKVTVRLDTSYKEEGGIDRIWRSPEVKVYEGVCYPGKDFVMKLPLATAWQGVSNSGIEDIDYVIEDNDLWVKTWVNKNPNTGESFLVGSLQDRIPSKNWFPTINTGYYYLGQEEYYLFSEPISVTPQDRDMPIATNVDFVPGKFDNGVRTQDGSSNISRNSGFEVRSTKKTVFKMNYKS